MLRLPPQNFTVPSGRDHEEEILFTDADGAPLDLTGGLVLFEAQAGNQDSDTADLIEKSSAEGTIEILDQTVTATKGRCTVLFVPADTTDLDQSVLEHEATAIDFLGRTWRGPVGAMTVLSNV